MAITASEVERLKVLEREFGIAGTLEEHVGIRYEDYINAANYGSNTVNIRDGGLRDPKRLHYLRSFIENPTNRDAFGFREENFSITDNSPQALAISDINSIIAHGSHLLGGFHAKGESKKHSGRYSGHGVFAYTGDMKRSVNTYFKPTKEEPADGYFFPVWVDCYLREGGVTYSKVYNGDGNNYIEKIIGDNFNISDNFSYSPPLNNFTKLENIGEFRVGSGYVGLTPSQVRYAMLKDKGDFLNGTSNPTVSAYANKRTHVSNLDEVIEGNISGNIVQPENAFYRFPNAYGLESNFNVETYSESLKNKWIGRIEEIIRLRIKFAETFIPTGAFRNEFIKILNYTLNNLRGLIRVVKKHNFILHSSFTDNTYLSTYEKKTEHLRYYVYVVHGVEIPNYEIYSKIYNTRIEVDQIGNNPNGEDLIHRLKGNLVGVMSRDLETPYPEVKPIALPPTQEEYDALPSDSATKIYFPNYRYVKLKGRVVTPESIIAAFKEMVMDPLNNLRLRNKNHPARQPYHEFLSNKLFVNYDGVLYTQDDLRYHRLESRRKVVSNDPVLFLGGPMMSDVLDDIYLYHKDEYLAGKIPDNKAFVKYVYDIARKLTLGRMEDDVSIKNTLNALGKIASALSCISTLEILYTDQDITVSGFTPQAFNNPYHSVDNPKLLCKLSRLQAPLVRDIPKLSTTEALKPYYYFAILDPRYALEDVMMKYKDIWTNQVLGERKVHELFTKVATDLMNNALKVKRLVVQVKDAQRGYLDSSSWGHTWGRQGHRAFVGGQFWGSSGQSVNVNLNLITREITHVNLEIGYSHTNNSGNGLHFRFSAVNRSTLAEDLRDADGNVINYNNPLAYWNGQYASGAYRDSGMIALRRSIPPTHMLKMFVYKEGDDSGDAVNVSYMHFKGFTFK